MGGNILKLFLAGAGIAVAVYTISNWNNYIDHTLPIIVIVAAAISVIWNLAVMK